jgi:hypothetical protein
VAFQTLDPRDPQQAEQFRQMFGPQQVDEHIRHAIQFCWMSLPKERQTAPEVEKEIRRLVERALRDLREDAAAFGFGPT